MKKFIYFMLSSLTLMTAFSSCNKNETEEIKDASIEITVDATTTNSITFTLTPENAVSYAYACVKPENENIAELTEVMGSEPGEITISELEENAEYTIIATATNAAGKTCQRVRETAITTASASVKIVVREAMAKAINTVFSPVNAASFEYFCVKTAEAASAEFIKVDNGEKLEILIDGLEPETEYTISARATNAQGEQGEITSVTATTSKLPVVEIKGITTDTKSAIISVEYSDTDSLYYSVVEKGGKPSEFTGIKASKSFSIFNLENETEYTIHLYGTDRNSYESQTVTSDFATQSRGDIGMEILSIGSRDVTVDTYFNSEKFSKIYCIVGDKSSISDMENFRWESYLDYCKSYEDDAQIRISEVSTWTIECNSDYRIGIVGVDKEGNIVKESAQWKEVTTGECVFGKSEASVKVNVENLKSTVITYSFISVNAASYVSNLIEKSKITDIEEYAMGIANYTTKNNFDTPINYTSLKPDTEYCIVVLPIDNEGNFGEIVKHDFRSEKVEMTGTGTVELKWITTSTKTVTYECTSFGETTKELRYLAVKKSGDDRFPDETAIINELAAGSIKKTLYAPKAFSVTLDEPNTEYTVYFMTLDNEGNYGKYFTEDIKSKDYVLDGNGTASAKILKTAISKPYVYLDYEITKGENTKGFYRLFMMEKYVVEKTDEELIDFIVQYNNYFTEDLKKENESISFNSYLLILPVDENDRFSPIIRVRLDDTFTGN